jgi:predicted 3-demethylubiquinone-9 3-methyltransferase (glyoxalase superfamily)
LWEKLSEDGWVQDRFGVSWQIVPSVLGELMADSDPEKAQRVIQAMLQMTKIEIEGLYQAYRE